MQISSSHQVCYGGGKKIFVAVFSAHEKFSGFRGLVHNYVHYSFCPVTHMFIYPNIKIIFPLHSFFTTCPTSSVKFFPLLPIELFCSHPICYFWSIIIYTVDKKHILLCLILWDCPFIGSAPLVRLYLSWYNSKHLINTMQTFTLTSTFCT